MSSVVLTGDTSGAGTITVPAVAGTFTATIGSATGTHYPFTAGTAVASTSGTSIDFTSIPSWVKRITVMFQGVSTNGTSNLLIQIGSGSITSSGYTSGAWSANVNNSTSTAGFLITGTNTSAGNCYGNIFINLFSSNSYVESHSIGSPANNNQSVGGGSVTLSGALDRVRITTVNGTDTFDAGSINILYE